MSEVILNRTGVDHVQLNLTTSGSQIASCTLQDLLLDPTQEYVLRVSELSCPMSSLPLFGYSTVGVPVNEQLFRIKKRIVGTTRAAFVAAGVNANDTTAGVNGFDSTFNTVGGGSPYFTSSGFISELAKSANNFSNQQDALGAPPSGQGGVPVNGTGSAGNNDDYLWVRLNADGCTEFVGTSLFWNNFVIQFSKGSCFLELMIALLTQLP